MTSMQQAHADRQAPGALPAAAKSSTRMQRFSFKQQLRAMNADLSVTQPNTAASPPAPLLHPEEDDVEKLLAASAALLASFDTTMPASPPVQREHQTTARSSKSRRTNSTRERMQQELQFLRSHVAELEAELEAALLREERQCDSESTPHQKTNDDSSDIVACRFPPMSAWEQVAKRQRCVRTHSETVNGSLRRQVARHARSIRGIRELLLAHQHDEEHIAWQEARHNHLNGRAIHDQWVSSLWREWQQRDAQQAYARASRKIGSLDSTPLISSPLLEATSATDGECERSAMRLLSRACSSHVFPFDVHATSTAAWPAIASIFDWHKLQSGDSVSVAAVGEAQILGTTDFRVVERTPTTYAIQYTVTLGTLQQQDCESECEQATVRAQERITYFPSTDTPTRTVLIWQTFIDTSTCTQLTNSKSDADTSIGLEGNDPWSSPSLIHGTGWLVLEKQPRSCSASIMRTLFEFYVDESATSDPEVYDTAKKVIKTWIALGQACLHTAELEMDKRLLLH